MRGSSSPARLPAILALLAGLGALSRATLADGQGFEGLRAVFPAGAQRGTVVEVTAAGDEVTQAAARLWFNHPGITSEKTADGRFRVTLRSDVPVGYYDVRAAGPRGVTDPRTFVVGDLPEVVEQEPDDLSGQATRLPSLPVVVNGQISRNDDMDCYSFRAEKGRRLVFDFTAASIDATTGTRFLFDGTMELLDGSGRRVAFNTDTHGTDPFLDVTVPETGDYVLKVWDMLYRGSDQCFYRIRVGEVPYLDYVFPAGGRRGTRVKVRYGGRNLPGGAPTGATIDGRPIEAVDATLELPAGAALPDHPAPIRYFAPAADSFVEATTVSLPSPGGLSNPRPFMAGDLPEVLEQEPNDSPEAAAPIGWPCVVNGQAGKPGDMDYFAFEASKGQALSFEVFAGRLGSPLDSVLKIYDDRGKPLAENDDLSPEGVPFSIIFWPKTTDSRITWTAPADGRYRLLLRHLYSATEGGPEYVYRLEVRPPEADFRVVTVPDHRASQLPDRQQVPRGGRMAWAVYALRRDGLDGEIRIEARGLPPGVALEPAVLGPRVTSGYLIFCAAADAPAGAFGEVTLTAVAARGKEELRRSVQLVALTGSTVNEPAPQRLGRSAVVSVTDAPLLSADAEPTSPTVAAGAKLPVRISLKRRGDWQGVVDLVPPEYGFVHGIQMANVSVSSGQSEATVELEVPRGVPPGRYAITLNAVGQAPRPGGSRRETYPTNPFLLTVTAPP